MATEHVNTVIVGSGFGGSVMAYRLAEAGLDVCVLERGKAYPPGSFPRTPHGLKKNFWDPSEGLYGMFDMWSFDGIDALVSSALGGGSIIYANVLLRKDEAWFARESKQQGGSEYWPITRADLDPHYDRVESMMNAQRYPFDRAPYDKTFKTQALKDTAEALGLDWHLPPLAVTFANEGRDPAVGEPIQEAHPNMHGRTRYTCRLCGECDLGCNYGSKNTLDHNYLSEAQRLGAELRTRCEVRRFAPRDGGYEVHYVEHDLQREGQPINTRTLPQKTITCDRLILAAGTLGTTYLMLKNRDAFPGLSKRLGDRFCGNGDLLSFVFNAQQKDEATGTLGPHVLDPNFGPVITSTIRMGDALDADGSTGRGFYIQDAGFPTFLSWIVESANVFGAVRRFLRLMRHIVMARIKGDTNLSAELQHLIGGTLSSTTMPLLGMGRDRPTGRLSVEKGRKNKLLLNCDWQVDDSRDYFDRLKQTMKDIADELNATFVVNPTWMLGRVITVHPLGGCPMGRSAEEGVVDAYGEVFNYPNLYIADGSVLPGPTGANPALTIAAVADRTADRMLEKKRMGTQVGSGGD